MLHPVKLLIFTGAVALAQSAPPPIIDIHLRALNAASQGPPPLSVCAPPTAYSSVESAAAWPPAFLSLLRNTSCDHPIRSPLTDDDLMEQTLAILKRRNIIAVTSGPRTEQWHKAANDRIIPGLMFNLQPDDPSLSAMRSMFQSGRFKVFGEVGIQYRGIHPADFRFEPYLALAEELDIPLAIHIGAGPSGEPITAGAGALRARVQSLLVLEAPLLRHPRLRVVALHAGWPTLDDTVAMLWAHPQLHVDVGLISFAIPRAAFHSYLRTIVDAGFGKRVLFGSDQMVWPRALEVAIDSIESAPFLTPSQKRDILYNNAARFLRLSQDHNPRHNGN